MIEKEQFENNMDWISYKITGKLPPYLQEETKQKNENMLVFYPNTHTKIQGRGSIYIKGESTTLCSCYEKDYEHIRQEFNELYDGTNLEELQRKFRKENNLQTGRTGITRLEDCNLGFSAKKGSNRLDVKTVLNKKTYTVCRCNLDEKPRVTKDFNRMKKNPNYTIEKIQEKMKAKYNMRHQDGTYKRQTVQSDDFQSRLFSHSITVTNDGMMYLDGKFIKTNKDIYCMLHSLLE